MPITVTIRKLLQNDVKLFYDYPIFDEAYRPILEKKITDHYWLHEIGQEEPGQFIHYLNERMRLIMPVYNKYYMAMNLEQRILDNYDVKEEYTREVGNDGEVTTDTTNINTVNLTNTNNGNNRNIRKRSDTPQSRITLDDNSFMTELNDDTTTDSATQTNSGTTGIVGNDKTITENNTTEHWVRTMKGNIGVQTDADAVNKYIESLINVDKMIIEELSDLFMLIY